MPEDIKNYLLSVSGIKSVNILDDENNINTFEFEYDDKIIKPQNILDEIELYMKPFFRPEMIMFNKHMNNVKKVKIDNPKICCEYCYLNCVYELFENEYINSFYSKRDNYSLLYEKSKYFEITYIKDDIDIKEVVSRYCDNYKEKAD